MSEVNIDAQLVADGGAELSRKEERLVEMSNGCICCTLRDDLLEEVRRLAFEGRFDYLIIESTGVSEPMPVAETFFFRDDAGFCLADISTLDTMVTVVDAANFERDFGSPERLKDRPRSRQKTSARSSIYSSTKSTSPMSSCSTRSTPSTQRKRQRSSQGSAP